MTKKDIVDKILSLLENEKLRKKLVNEGRLVFSKIPNAKERAIKYLEICNSCIY